MRRRKTLVECSICKEWKCKEVLEIVGKSERYIRKKNIACLKCLVVKIEILMEEIGAGGKMQKEMEDGDKRWMKSEDYLKKEEIDEIKESWLKKMGREEPEKEAEKGDKGKEGSRPNIGIGEVGEKEIEEIEEIEGIDKIQGTEKRASSIDRDKTSKVGKSSKIGLVPEIEQDEIDMSKGGGEGDQEGNKHKDLDPVIGLDKAKQISEVEIVQGANIGDTQEIKRKGVDETDIEIEGDEENIEISEEEERKLLGLREKNEMETTGRKKYDRQLEADRNSLVLQSTRVGLVQQEIVVDLEIEKEITKNVKQLEDNSKAKENRESMGEINRNTDAIQEIEDFLGKKGISEKQRSLIDRKENKEEQARKVQSVRKKVYTQKAEIDIESKTDDEITRNNSKGGKRTIDQIEKEIMEEIREEERRLQREVKEVGIEEAIRRINEGIESERNEEMLQNNREKQVEIKKKDRVIVVGDSLMAHFKEYVLETQYEMGFDFADQLELTYKRGAMLDEILEEVRNVRLEEEEGAIIIIQGGGNNFLMDRGVLQWMKISQCILEVWRKYKNVTFGVVGLTRRTAEKKEFEDQRKRAQEIWGEEIEFWMEDRKKKNKPPRCLEGITFLNMECVVKNRHLYDGVHMNKEGASKFYRKIAVYAQVMTEKREEIREEESRNMTYRKNGETIQGVLKSKNEWVRLESEFRKQEKKQKRQETKDDDAAEKEKNYLRTKK